MSTTALIDGFRRLRPIVRDWLARDLASTPGHEPTRAYADLTLAFGFARLGAADDATQCANDAESILGQSADESHGWLLRLYRYRIDEALRGNRHGGIVPDCVRSPNAAETQQRAAGDGNATGGREVYVREVYVTDQFLTQSRVLDPEECTDPYRAWTKNLSARGAELARFRYLTDAAQSESTARALLKDAETNDAQERAALWADVFPMVRRACPGFATELIFALPDVLGAPASSSDPSWQRKGLRLFQHAVEHVAGLPDAEPFPPLVAAGIALVAREREAAQRCGVLTRITWPCLRWFRKLDRAEEAETFLYHTREMWPATEQLAGRSRDARGSALHAFLARAACRAHAGHGDEPAQAIQLANETADAHHRRREWTPKDETDLAMNVARVAALLTPADAFTQIANLLARLPRISNTYTTTAAHYSRFHLQIVEAVVLAFPAVGDF